MMEQPMDALPDPEPVAMLEEFVDIATLADLAEPAPAPQGAPAAGGDIDDLQAVFSVPVKVQAVLGRARMPIGEMLRLRSGMVIDLDRKVGEAVDIFVNDRLIARGEVVLVDECLGITLTEIVQADR